MYCKGKQSNLYSTLGCWYFSEEGGESPNILGVHKFLEIEMGGGGCHKFFDDQNVGSHKSHKMPIDSVFILFERLISI